MHIEQYVLLPQQPQPIPPYDVEGGLAFFKKFVPLLMAGSHWLVLADAEALLRFEKVQAGLEATFEMDPVPNNPGLFILSYQKSLLGREELVSRLNEQFPGAAMIAELLADVIALATTPRSQNAMYTLHIVLSQTASIEEKQTGAGYRLAQAALIERAKHIAKVRVAHLN